MEEVKPSLKKTKDAVKEAIATLGGFLFGNFAMTIAEKYLPSQAVPAVGGVGLIPHFANMDDTSRAFGNGVLAAGVTDGLKKVTAGKDGIVGKLHNALPGRGSFSGMAGYAPGNSFELRGFGNVDPMDVARLSGPAMPAAEIMNEQLLVM